MGSPAKGKRLGIGEYIRDRLRAGDDTKTILKKTRAKFPLSRAMPSDVYWNKRRLRDEEKRSKARRGKRSA